MRIELDNLKCVAAGQCVMAAPEIFDQRDEDGIAILLVKHIDPALHESAREAAAVCPAAAIRLLEQ